MQDYLLAPLKKTKTNGDGNAESDQNNGLEKSFTTIFLVVQKVKLCHKYEEGNGSPIGDDLRGFRDYSIKKRIFQSICESSLKIL